MRDSDLLSDELWVCHLGVVPYTRGLAIQETLRERRISEELPDTLLLLEHPPVYTRGRRSGAEDLPLGEDHYREKGIEVHTTDRGGRLTYHGPGQLVGYPIMAIADIGSYLRTMEAAIVAAIAEEGVTGHSRHDEGIDYTGVWVGERKIASIGVHVSHGVTTHGFAVNVVNDLEPFSWVIACGLPDVAMTSLQRELGPERSTGLECVRRRVAFHFAEAHGRRQRLVSARRLGIDTTNAAGLASERAPIKTLPAAAAEPVPVYPMAGHR
jgi:lipoyl(octanoyl) transferase